jgi:hypothetical protein
MIERTHGKDLLEKIVIGFLVLIFCVYFSFSAGIVSLPEKPVAIIAPIPESTVVVSTQITTVPTPSALPTYDADFVDPYQEGMRNEGQWYKWYRADVQGLKDMNVGVVVYRRAFLDRYAWYNAVWGNYFSQRPAPGMRYFVVWIHEEMFGVNQTDDPRMWGFDESAFRLQVGDRMIDSELNITYNPVNRIKEFEGLSNYYDTVTAGPFSWLVSYTGTQPKQGGFEATRQGWIRMGKENGFDGYVIYEIPRDTKLEDLILHGAFSKFGSAQWQFL